MSIEIDFGVIALQDYDEDGHPQASTDSPGIGSSSGTQPAEVLTPLGLGTRALDADGGGRAGIGLGAPCLEIWYGDRRYVLPLEDPRDVAKVPKLRKGGRILAGGAGEHRSFVAIDGLDPSGTQKPGSISIFASYSKGGSKKSLGVSLNVRDEGDEEITLVHGDGARVTIDKDGTSITSPNGEHYAHVTNDGNVLAGDSKIVGSCAVGEAAAALPVAIGPVVASALTALAAAVATITLDPAAKAAPAAVAPFISQLSAKHLRTT